MLRDIAGLACSGALLILAIMPVEVLQHGPTLCLIKAAFGRECLGCGLTRSVSMALHGEWMHALASNGLVIVVLPLLILGAVAGLVSVARRAMEGKKTGGEFSQETT
jgi:hypothetical protein